MKKLIESIAIGILLTMFCYLGISFYHLDINPHNWGEGDRFLFILFTWLAIVLAVTNHSKTK